MIPAQLSTSRLALRQWTDADLIPFAEMNADPEVMKYFPATLSRDESDAFAIRIQSHIESAGWGLWAVEQKYDGKFIGFVGLRPVHPELEFSPTVEIGWRLAKNYWGQGYATEAGLECLRFGFEDLQLPEIVSYTSAINLRSISVMKRLGLTYHSGDFNHPLVPENHRLRPLVLYSVFHTSWPQARHQINGCFL